MSGLNKNMKIDIKIFLLIIDNGLLICHQIGDVCVLPHFDLSCDYNDSELVKRDFLEKTKLKIKRRDFMFLLKTNDGTALYCAVVNVNYGSNLKFLSKCLSGSKEIEFMHLDLLNWDDVGKIAIRALRSNPNYENVFRFIDSDSKFDYYSAMSKRTIKRAFNNVTNMWQFDRPDVVVETIKGITGVECFKINAAGSSRKGSVGIMGKKEMEKELTKGKLFEMNTVSKHFSNSIYKLWSDFSNSFSNHIKNVPFYRKHLKSVCNNKTTSLGFYIEDTTLLGTYYHKNNRNMVVFYLFYLKEFWDLFLNAKGLLFIIFQQTGCDVKNMFFITKHDYTFLLEKDLIVSINDVDAQFFDEPHLIGTTFPL